MSLTLTFVKYKSEQSLLNTNIGKLLEFGRVVNCVDFVANHWQLIQLELAVMCDLVACQARAPVLMAVDGE